MKFGDSEKKNQNVATTWSNGNVASLLDPSLTLQRRVCFSSRLHQFTIFSSSRVCVAHQFTTDSQSSTVAPKDPHAAVKSCSCGFELKP